MIKVVGVTLGNKKRVYYFSPNNIVLSIDDSVIVETEKGEQFGFVSQETFDLENSKIKGQIKPVVRKASKTDFEKYEKNFADAKLALIKAKELVVKHNLKMHITSCDYTFNREQLMFKFLADERIDFRGLAKELASLYHTRIELYQIGVRDKAKEVGGIGPCGMVLCCHKFLNDFETVSINMAKNQNIALNPTKINGQCGRLLCCLKYEDDCYKECKKELPKEGTKINTEHGEGKIISVDIFTKNVRAYVPNHGVVEFKYEKQ
jgi:cell fate regulator YaaT (PSP1 superfamily)